MQNVLTPHKHILCGITICKHREWNTTQRITREKFPIYTYPNVESQNGIKITNPTRTDSITSRPEICRTFAYSSLCVLNISKVFKHTNIYVSFHITNTVSNFLKHINQGKLLQKKLVGTACLFPRTSIAMWDKLAGVLKTGIKNTYCV